jgi:FHA domain
MNKSSRSRFPAFLPPPSPSHIARAGICRGRNGDAPAKRIAPLTASCGALVAAQFYSLPANALGAADILGTVQTSAHWLQNLLARGYSVAPALMLGLLLLALMPLLALLSKVIMRDRLAAVARPHDSDAANAGPAHFEGESSGLPAHAFLEVIGPSQTRFAMLHDMMRIGREDDNDIRIPSNAVHGYHAAIHREAMDDWHITDLSGTDGDGIRINGQRCSDARLSDGDVIELGPGRLRFRAGMM